jgi:methyl-accepting chemotaxis protein
MHDVLYIVEKFRYNIQQTLSDLNSLSAKSKGLTSVMLSDVNSIDSQIESQNAEYNKTNMNVDELNDYASDIILKIKQSSDSSILAQEELKSARSQSLSNINGLNDYSGQVDLLSGTFLNLTVQSTSITKFVDVIKKYLNKQTYYP